MYAGSSPLTRGKLRDSIVLPFGLGLIPAHAGKTVVFRTTTAPRKAHPRSRGENHKTSRNLDRHDGSSPLTRGKHLERDDQLRTLRLIPAHAGKTEEQRLGLLPLPAHPRSRGENMPSTHIVDSVSGSSPLTRGKLTALFYLSVLIGLIPAHAGKTSQATTTATRNGAHPRSRGENTKMLRIAMLALGSSPLTRGKLAPRMQPFFPKRLIPAHAGKTESEGVRTIGVSAHPRSRGENPHTSQISRQRRGSSPLTRGKLS